jgi:uncharacterized protein YxjI
MKPRLIIEQKITAFVNKYAIFAAAENGEKAQPVGLAQQKRLAFKEKVNFFSDDTKSQLAFSFRAEKVMDIHGRFIVEDASGNLIGMFKKDFSQSLVRSTWHILDQNGNPQFTITESNPTLAALRRFAGFIPLIGDVFELVLLFFKYHFVILDANQAVRGTYTKTTLFRDHYTLSSDDQLVQWVDWRVLASVAVALDALQSR